MGHQKFHLIGQDFAISQNKVFPKTGDVRGVQQGHASLFWRPAAFSVIA
jgi:hypothetical protein